MSRVELEVGVTLKVKCHLTDHMRMHAHMRRPRDSQQHVLELDLLGSIPASPSSTPSCAKVIQQ